MLHEGPERSGLTNGGCRDGSLGSIRHITGSCRAPWPEGVFALYCKYLGNCEKLEHVYLIFCPVLFTYLRPWENQRCLP